MKKKVLLTLALTMAFAACLTGCGKSSTGTNGEVVVYNWGEYIDPDTLDQFEEETGIHVVYDEFETNEIMYPKVESGTSNYDVVCPSDYMIQKMIENDLLAEINFDNIPNVKNIGEQYFEQSKGFDPETNTAFHTASEPLVFYITRQWLMSRSIPGMYYGMKNMRITS